MDSFIKQNANFSIVVATRRRVPGTRRFVEELLARPWIGGTVRNAACRLVVPDGLRFSAQDWDDSPFSSVSYPGGRSAPGEQSGASDGPLQFRHCLQSCVICWPNLRVALDLLSRFAGWLPDADCRAWEFQDLWRAAFPVRRKAARRVTLAEVAARIGSAFGEPANTDQIAALLGEAVQFLDYSCGLERVQSLMAGRSEIDFSRFKFSYDWLAGIPETPGI